MMFGINIDILDIHSIAGLHAGVAPRSACTRASVSFAPANRTIACRCRGLIDVVWRRAGAGARVTAPHAGNASPLNAGIQYGTGRRRLRCTTVLGAERRDFLGRCPVGSPQVGQIRPRGRPGGGSTVTPWNSPWQPWGGARWARIVTRHEDVELAIRFAQSDGLRPTGRQESS